MAIVFTGIVIFFRKQFIELFSSIRRLKYGDTEIEMFGFTKDRDIDILLSALQNGPHSFEWLRKSQFMKLTDDEFNSILDNNPSFFIKTKMVKNDTISGDTILLNGVKLTKTAMNILSETEYSGSGSGSSPGTEYGTEVEDETGTGTGSGSGLPFGSGSHNPRDF